MISRSLRHRAPALWLLLPFMAGVVAGRLTESRISPTVFLLGAGVFLIACVFARNRDSVWALTFCCATVCAAAAYFQLRDQRPAAWDELPSREALLTARIVRVFNPSKNPGRLSAIAEIENADGAAAELVHQTIYLSLQNPIRAPAIRTALLRVRGQLTTLPRSATGSSFDGYLINAGVNFRLERGRVLSVLCEPTRYAQFCDNLRKRLSAILGWGLDNRPELAAGNRALFLGDVSSLGADRKQLYVETGTLHFFAIDGLHIAAVGIALHLLFGLTRCPKLIAFLAVAIVLWLYADATGRSPSAVRAVLTVLFFEGAFLLKRPINALASLSASALIALVISPHELFGASFQMSYGIVAGLLLLGLPLAENWKERWVLFRHLPKVSWGPLRRALNVFQRAFVGGLAVGLSTALVGDLCGVLFFQLYAPSAIFANLLLIPVASAGLWASFCASVSGLLGQTWLASVFNHASAVLLLSMERCIQHLVTLPGAVIPLSFRSITLGFIAMGTLLGSLLYGYATQWNWRRGGWAPPFAITALALILATQTAK